MKKIYCILVFLLVLSSCSHNKDYSNPESSWSQTISPENTQVDQTVETLTQQDDTDTFTPQASVASWSELSARVKQKYKESDSFLSCSENALDSCISEESNDTGQQISCDDYIVEQNRVICQDNQILAIAIESLDPLECDRLSVNSESCKTEIITQKAKTEKDPELCNTLSGSLLVSCNNSVVFDLAQQWKDPKLCDGIISEWQEGDNTFEKQFCIEEVELQLELDSIQTGLDQWVDIEI